MLKIIGTGNFGVSTAPSLVSFSWSVLTFQKENTRVRMSVVVETTIGDLTVDLYTKERPKASLNFIKLCKLKKFNMNLFHMVQPNFIAQTGDPTGTGRGGESVFQELYGNQARYRYWFIYAFKFLSPGGCGFLRNMNKLKIPVLGRNL